MISKMVVIWLQFPQVRGAKTNAKCEIPLILVEYAVIARKFSLRLNSNQVQLIA